MEISFEFVNQIEEDLSIYNTMYHQIIEATLQYLNIQDDVELSCIIVDNEEIHRINQYYRHIDRETDVISFALEDDTPLHIEGLPRSLGDIFISYPKAVNQAQEYGHSIHREMCFLFVHGLLHLLGYDHMTSEEEKEMFHIQEEILSFLNIVR